MIPAFSTSTKTLLAMLVDVADFCCPGATIVELYPGVDIGKLLAKVAILSQVLKHTRDPAVFSDH